MFTVPGTGAAQGARRGVCVYARTPLHQSVSQYPSLTGGVDTIPGGEI